MIDVVTIIITRDQVEFFVIGPRETVKEVHVLDDKNILQNSSGNFEDEALFEDHDGLINAITTLADGAGDICRELRKQ